MLGRCYPAVGGQRPGARQGRWRRSSCQHWTIRPGDTPELTRQDDTGHPLACHGRRCPSPGRLLKGVEADHRTGQHGQGVEAFGGTLIADPQSPEAIQPGPGAFDRPPVAAQPGRGLNPAAGDAGLDPSPAQLAGATAVIVGLVGMHLAGTAPPAAGGHADRRDVLQHRLQHGRVVGVGRAHDQR